MSDLQTLTARQGEILAAIVAYWREHAKPPSIRELCDTLGISSTNGLTTQLRLLERKGAVEWERGRGSRGLWPAGGRDKIRAIFAGAA